MSSMRVFPGTRFMHFHSQLKYVSPRDNVFYCLRLQTQLSKQIYFVLVNDSEMFLCVYTNSYEWYCNLVWLSNSLGNSNYYFSVETSRFCIDSIKYTSVYLLQKKILLEHDGVNLLHNTTKHSHILQQKLKK